MKMLHTYQNLWNTFKAVSRGKFVLLNYQLLKENSKVNSRRFYWLYQQLIHWATSSLADRKEL